ncbi:two-component system regulatory protein YycI [Rossellomorea sp. SC111]|uniref:two-component system regulatory protein YycI n=1 Tax=Rossellomorea sp. SC111 TaxID=2968985 RepID=UPI00215B3082|nr:two-component system regulatory protein YycI [Rossellomorea sp. SC111]MCR8849881.1 two-component system regulatory protein YycI [Rossellomorea sp. SC111]
MDWSKTKSIFIIVFLVLDIFLMSLFINKVGESNPETLSQATFEEKLKADKIKYPKTLSQDPTEEKYIQAKSRKFKDEDLNVLKNQDVTILNENTIHSTLDDPVALDKDFSPDDLADFMKNQVLDGNKYSFWDYNKDEQIITYFQTYQGRQLFNNTNGKIVLTVNNENKIVSYKQSMLEDLNEFGEDKSIIPSFVALQGLYTNQKIGTGSVVHKPKLGYWTFLSEESQVLAPTWHFVVESGNKEEDLFINAVEGQIVEINKPEKETLE